MATLDLRPLTDEAIEKMAIKADDLWIVKIHHEVFGPFETESLKHYAYENGAQFEFALVARTNEDEYLPFWTHPSFQRRRNQEVNGQEVEGPFWLMNMGLKVGPLYFQEVDKQLEMGLISLSDRISNDDGHTWHKIYEIKSFDRRSHTPEELPELPNETSFQNAKLVLVEKLERNHDHTSDELATMAHLAQQNAKVIQFKTEDVPFTVEHQTQVSSATKWMVSATFALMFSFFVAGYFFLNPELEQPTVTDISEIKLKKAAVQKVPQGQIPQVTHKPSPAPEPRRRPASVDYSMPAPTPAMEAVNQESRYPTHVETHPNEYVEEPYFEKDPRDMSYQEIDQRVEEHSLIGADPQMQDLSLDAAMNGQDRPAEPVVEELSDF
jgi:hypothetical protein